MTHRRPPRTTTLGALATLLCLTGLVLLAPSASAESSSNSYPTARLDKIHSSWIAVGNGARLYDITATMSNVASGTKVKIKFENSGKKVVAVKRSVKSGKYSLRFHDVKNPKFLVVTASQPQHKTHTVTTKLHWH